MYFQSCCRCPWHPKTCQGGRIPLLTTPLDVHSWHLNNLVYLLFQQYYRIKSYGGTAYCKINIPDFQFKAFLLFSFIFSINLVFFSYINCGGKQKNEKSEGGHKICKLEWDEIIMSISNNAIRHIDKLVFQRGLATKLTISI